MQEIVRLWWHGDVSWELALELVWAFMCILIALAAEDEACLPVLKLSDINGWLVLLWSNESHV